MPTVRHIIVCEGESEWAYLQRLQSFIDDQEVPPGSFEAPLHFISPKSAIARTGSFGKLKTTYNKYRMANGKRCSIQIWSDFDVYNRNDKHCAEHYAQKTTGIPDFLFSFHNFEDFYALHFDGQTLEEWLSYGGPLSSNHFASPLHSSDYMPEVVRIFPGYKKGGLPPDFVSKASLQNLKNNLNLQPESNPHNLQGIHSFARFIIAQIEKAYPNLLI
jgi:hypothetical protein